MCLSCSYCSVINNTNWWCGPFQCFFLTLFFPLLTQCTQSTKDVLERMVHTFDFHGLCPPGTPKTTPLGQEVSSTAAIFTEASPSTGCPTFSRSSKRDSLHSINPAFRLASPSPSLGRATLILGNAPDIGFIPPPWVHPVTIREQKESSCARPAARNATL